MKNLKRYILPLAILAVLAAALALFLSRLGSEHPSQAADGTPWDESWTMIGSVLGVEDPGNGFTLLDNNTVLASNDLYYASWTCGEAAPYTNDEGDEVDLYPAQLYLLLQGCADAENARKAAEAWSDRERETYTVREERTQTINGQDYTLLLYDCASETNPYSRGVSAFTVYGASAVSVELTCQDGFTGDELVILTDFLGGFHYGTAGA